MVLVAFGDASARVDRVVGRGERAVVLQVATGVVVEHRSRTLSTPLSSVAVPARATFGAVTVNVPPPVTVAFGALSPGICAWKVSRPWLLDDVVRPSLSVARTVKLYEPGVRLNGVVYDQL